MQRIGAKAGCGVGFFGTDKIDKPVREFGQGRGIRLGGADVHVAEDLRGIDADDVAGDMPRDFKRQSGLAAGGRADQKNCRREPHRPRMKRRSSSAIESCTQVGRP